MAGESSQPSQTLVEQPSARQPFDAHVELLRLFLARRDEVVTKIERLLDAERKGAGYLQDLPTLSRHFGECFFALAGLTAEHAHLERELETAHWASGFKPRQTAGQHNDLIDPAEIAARAFLLWQRTRWPGDYGRTLYAHTLFNLYLLRRLMLLSMRIWDAGSPSERLGQVQRLLDELWRTTPTEQPVLVRDARWLLPLAQSPTTDELHGYLEVAARIAETLPAEDRLEINEASVRMAGGHLRSQLRHVSAQQRAALDDHDLSLSTRKSNALDLATLVQGLVPLLEAYECAAMGNEGEKRLELADAICQGISSDPELFLNRVDLLGPYSMIEHLFIAAVDGRVGYTPMGERHLRLIQAYATLLRRVAEPLHEDCGRFRPERGAYSPYGVLYGFSSRLLEHMALKATQRNAATRFSLEDVFVGGDADKLAWVSGWRQLPHVPRDVIKQFDYPQQFAEDVYGRIERALRRLIDAGSAQAAAPNGRLFVVFEDDPATHSKAASLRDLPLRFVESSDRQVVAARKAIARDEAELMSSRLEGEFVVSYRTPGGWTAVTKDALTDVMGAGLDARIVGLPHEAARVLQLMCPELVVIAESADSSSC